MISVISSHCYFVLFCFVSATLYSNFVLEIMGLPPPHQFFPCVCVHVCNVRLYSKRLNYYYYYYYYDDDRCFIMCLIHLRFCIIKIFIINIGLLLFILILIIIIIIIIIIIKYT